ncbi:MAG: energy-coupling factor transporter transmembrane protein EcfT [Mycoplasmatales bacterium]|nr:energy-coupling factor transporter transmembrane protein EcfT [Mycoplasmatales bacterium]
MNITVGKYIPGNSFIHKLDPRIKLLSNILFIVLVFLTKNFIMQAILLSPILVAYFVSKLKLRKLYKMMLPVILIGIFLFLINSFLVKESSYPYMNVYAKWWQLTISDISLYRTALIMVRIYIMIIITTMLTATTRPMALTRAIEDLLLPLKLLFIPVHIIAMIISIALRFIPTLLEESQRIMKAQASRGVDFKNGNIKSKSKATITLIIPLFVSAFSKAEDLGNAMETRGYDPYEKRTKYRIYPIKVSDVLVFMFLIGLLAMIILQRMDIFELPLIVKGA